VSSYVLPGFVIAVTWHSGEKKVRPHPVMYDPFTVLEGIWAPILFDERLFSGKNIVLAGLFLPRILLFLK
jgi:hypothetical protein